MAESPLAFPLAVKIDSPDIPHKTEADAVRLDVSNLADLKAAAAAVVANAVRYKPGAQINGVLLAEMAAGTEVIIGVVNDQFRSPTFVEDLAFGIISILNKKATGIYHLAGKDILTPWKMAMMIADYLNADKSLIKELNSLNFSQPA